MRNQSWDSIESFLAELLLVEKISARKAVPEACRQFRELPVGYLVLSLASAASVFDTGQLTLASKDPKRALELFRAATMVASDVAMYEILGRKLENCGQLLEYWRATEETYFEA